MKEKRLTFEGDLLKLYSLAFGEILVAKKEQVAEVFDPQEGLIDLKGVKLLLTDEETEEVRHFLAM